MEITLNEYKNKHSNNVDNHVMLNIETDSGLLHNSTISDVIDQFQQYVKEKDESNIYRLAFTINPVCSNVLFNAITEIVSDEGSDECEFYGTNIRQGNSLKEDAAKYASYRGATLYDHDKFMRDTAFSHPDLGGFVYHCGYDIFNNHTLRNKEFSTVNRLGDNVNNREKFYFNTIEDFVRNKKGETIRDIHMGIDIRGLYDKLTTPYETIDSCKEPLRNYTYDTLYTFAESINNNLIEKEGWLGFTNPASINIPNVKIGDNEYTVNKCMNNNKACEFIDMYPDRSLYSFIPKFNKHRNRIEPNWDVCLTYPYKNYYNELVEDAENQINGLFAEIVTNLTPSEEGLTIADNEIIVLRTTLHHNLKPNDIVQISMIYEENVHTAQATVANVGDDGFSFGIRYDSISDYLRYHANSSPVIRIRKVVNGIPCEYYFRIFKRVPNFANTDVYNDGIVSDDEINDNCNNDFTTMVNKIAFSRTIFNDNMVQVLFNDDINTNGLKDNLGRPLSELYLTIVKNNKGYEEWYDGELYNYEGITFSHCFGKVTAGLDLPPYVEDYNVHKIHNVQYNEDDAKKELLEDIFGKYGCTSVQNLEQNDGEITINGDTSIENDGEFFGDIVEFDKSNVLETTIEDVYFRFNTAQRECLNFTVDNNTESATTVSGEFANLKFDEIIEDDYDYRLKHRFNSDAAQNFIEEQFFNTKEIYKNDSTKCKVDHITHYPANIFHEGYYYKPHYKVAIKQLSDEVSIGEHALVNFTVSSTTDSGKTVFIITDKDYQFHTHTNGVPSDKVFVWYKGEAVWATAEATSVDTPCNVVITLPKKINMDGLKLFKYNTMKPNNAHELNDGSGRFVWRDFKKEQDIMPDDELYDSIFVNGAHYFHKRVNFFLRRQDPLCEYGLSYCGNDTPHISNLIIAGNVTDISQYDYIREEDTENLC